MFSPNALAPMMNAAGLGAPTDQANQPDVAPSPDNPMTQSPEQAANMLGISDDDKKILVDTITTYRTGWATDRLLRLARWMRNDLMYRGHQILGWDQQQGVYYDALALYMQSGEQKDGDDTYLQSFQNNITKMLGTAFVGTMSRSVPPVVIRPENAIILADVTTAKFAQEAVSIVERMNDIRGLLRGENTMLYLFGAYFKHTRAVIDGSWAGYDEEPVYADVTVIKPNRYHCSNCGKDVPVGQDNDSGSIAGNSDVPSTPDTGAGGADGSGDFLSMLGAGGGEQSPERSLGPSATCLGCHSPLGSADFYPSESVTEEHIVGTKRVPRAMVKWTIHSPLEIDADPEAKKLKDSPIMAFDMEVDLGTLRRIYPNADIQEGSPISTTPNAAFERLRRNESYSQGYAFTSDSFQAKPTYSQVWVQPEAYYRQGVKELDDNGETFAQRMERIAPDGLKLSMIGNEVVDIRTAVLEKEWTHCVLIENCGLYPPSVADDVVPFNIRINGAMDIMDDYYQRCTNGMLIADAKRLDRREFAGKTMVAGGINFVNTKAGGMDKPLGESIMQVKFEMDQNISQYVPQLWNMCLQIAGLPPQVFGGGTTEGVDTATGQQQQQDQAQTRLNVFFENEKAEHAEAAQNAIECLQKAHEQGLMMEIWTVEESNGSEFRNNYVDLNKMTGRVRISAQADAGLPQSPEQLRAFYQELLQMAGGPNPNPAVIALLDCVENQETILASLGGEGMVLPAAHQRARTLEHINTLLQEQGPMMVQQDGSIGYDLPVKPQIGYDDFVTLLATIKEFRQINWDEEPQNPEGWQRLEQYYQLAMQLETKEAATKAQMQKQVTQAGAPDPDPQEQQAKQLLLQDGSAAVQQLAGIAAIPPAVAIPAKALPAVVSAGGRILDNALKLAK